MTSGALASLREYTQGITYEVFVVDNGSTQDESVVELPRRFPWIRLLCNLDNQGFTRANNQGLELARGRHVLLLNNDTIQTENALGVAVRYLDEHADLGALGIMHRNNDAARSFQPSFFGYPRLWADTFALLGYRTTAPTSATEAPAEQDTDWVCGSFLLMRQECLKQIGKLDERFFIYDEDVDWCRRATKAGWKVRFWPGVSMVHLGAASNPLMKDKTFTMFRSRLSYLLKHHGLAAGSFFYAAMGLRLMGATAKQTLRYLVGLAPRQDVAQRWRRQREFLSLQPGRHGG